MHHNTSIFRGFWCWVLDMKVYLCFVATLLICISTTHALYGTDDPVTLLNEENFDEFISRPGVNVVKFYASWCSHCENFAPKFKKAASVLKGFVSFGVVDNEAHGNFGDRFNVGGYPTVLIFRNDRSVTSPTKYSGPRTVEGLTEFLMKQVHEVVVSTAKKEGVKLDFDIGASCSSSSSSTCGGSSDHSSSQQKDTDSRQQQQHGSQEAEITLTDANFDSLVLQSDYDWLVAFIAPWCGHCQNLKPEWRKAAEKLRGKVKVGTVDATVHENLARRYQIRGFPTIKYFKSGVVEDYDRGRFADDIVAFGLEKYDLNKPPPEVKEITSNSILHEACDEKQLCVIGFLPNLLDCQSKCRKRYLDVMKKVADKYKSNDWGWLWSASRTHKLLEEAFDIGGFGYPALVTVNLRKDKYAVMHGSFSVDGIREFLHELGQGRSSSTLNVITYLPEIEDSKPWDGNDAPVVHEEEIDLSELGIKVEL
nr:protein disulfide isomerase A6 [Hymenolepis microstoma]CUU98685.1 protein disulfide isomerase A6 [Hymenolepis microstoma]